MNETMSLIRLQLLRVAIAAMLVTAVWSSGTAQGWDLDELEAFLNAAVEEQIQEHNIANAAVAVVAGGEIVVVQGYGYADIERQRAVEADKTMFRIGSTAKLFTWTAVMQLVEQGKLDLNTDINQYLDFEIPNEIVTLGRAADPITLAHLMTHTPGFEDYMSDIFSLDVTSLRPLGDDMRDNLPARVFPPGQVVAYSNYGASLAGYIVERTAGVPFAQYVEDNILSPLQMDFSTFRQPLPNHLSDHSAKPYRFVDGEFREASFEYMSEPAGSMSSSAGDMARFMLAHLQEGQLNGARILDAITVQTMQTQLFTHHSSLHGMAHGFLEGRFNGRRVLFHPGGTMLYDTVLYLLPEEQVGFFMTHSGGNHMLNLVIFQDFMDRYFPGESAAVVAQPQPTAAVGQPTEVLTGEYQQNRRSFTTEDKMLSLLMGTIRIDADRDGYLLVQHFGGSYRFAEAEPGVFHNIDEQPTLDFAGSFDTIVFDTDPLGRTLLLMDGPVSYSQAPWYEQGGPNLIGLGFSILFIVGSLLYWGVKAGVLRLRRRDLQKSAPLPAENLARWAAVLFGILTLVFVLDFLIVSEPDPVYILPPPAYGVTSAWSGVLDQIIPWLMATVGAVVLAFAIVVWKRRYWRLPSRIHYTMFAGAAVLLLVLFRHWNIWIW